jgi:hypothetical protein
VTVIQTHGETTARALADRRVASLGALVNGRSESDVMIVIGTSMVRRVS